MTKLLLFFGSFILTLIFTFDLLGFMLELDYIPVIINPEINKLFIGVFGFIVSISSTIYFASEYFMKK